MKDTVTIEANTLEELTLNYDAGPAAIGRAIQKIQEFLDNVLIEAIHSRELRNGTQPTVTMANIVGALGQLSQMLGASSGLATPQLVPPGGMRQ